MLKYLIKNREQAGILKENPYIFAIPHSKDIYLDVCELMRHFSNMCSAKNLKTLRGTILRKDLATKSMVRGDIPVNDMADFEGHDPKIHVNHYRLPRATRDLTRVSRMLMLGSGVEEVNSEDNARGFDSAYTMELKSLRIKGWTWSPAEVPTEENNMINFETNRLKAETNTEENS
ncbi:hypothetical protein JTB14_022479 [Gonioctena quinquepunctata]|nr:hypothetical protein JTB14_022479 [Gonioctena quinquepunctata]